MLPKNEQKLNTGITIAIILICLFTFPYLYYLVIKGCIIFMLIFLICYIMKG